MQVSQFSRWTLLIGASLGCLMLVAAGIIIGVHQVKQTLLQVQALAQANIAAQAARLLQSDRQRGLPTQASTTRFQSCLPEMAVANDDIICLLGIDGTMLSHSDSGRIGKRTPTAELSSLLVLGGATAPLLLGLLVLGLLVIRWKNRCDKERMQHGLFESERQSHALIEQANDPIIIIQHGTCVYQNSAPADRVIRFANPATARIFGYGSIDEIIGKDFRVLVAPEDCEGLENFRQARLRGDEAPTHYEFQGRQKDGNRIWIECLVSLVHWEGQAATMLTFLDMSARKLAETNLQIIQFSNDILDFSKLAAMIDTWGPARDEDIPSAVMHRPLVAAATEARTHLAPLDETTVLALLDMADEDDPDFFRNLVNVFMIESTKLVKTLQTASVSGDAAQLALSAHSLKGSSNNVGVLAAGELCQQIQLLAEREELTDVAPLIQQLQIELEQASTALKQAADTHHL